jgi:hypothetical protein
MTTAGTSVVSTLVILGLDQRIQKKFSLFAALTLDTG